MSLRRWLDDPGKTWRWSRGDTDGYEAVELRAGALRWYRHSHDTGTQDEVRQELATFLAEGPPRTVPPAVTAAVRAHIASMEEVGESVI